MTPEFRLDASSCSSMRSVRDGAVCGKVRSLRTRIRNSNGDEVRTDGSDPVLRLVRIALALYLSPVVLVVCLIGGASIVLSKAVRAAERLASWPTHRVRYGHLLLTRPGDAWPGPRFRGDRERTHVGH